MTGLAGWLLVIAVVDLFRAGRDTSTPLRRGVLATLALLGVIATAASAHPRGAIGWGSEIAAAVLGAAWVLGSARALDRRPAPDGNRRRTAFVGAYAAFVLAVVLLGLAGSRTGHLGWLADVLSHSVLAGTDPERVLVAAAVLTVQLSTANLLIRMLLDAVGVPASDNEKNLRGGRVLGPMERLTIVGLGLAGNLTGASIVVAAKALLRFPELRPGRSGGPGSAPSDVSEYFLIGSFASWIVAFAGVALASA